MKMRFFKKRTKVQRLIHAMVAGALTIGLVVAGYFSSSYLGVIFADAQATITRNTDTHFSQGTLVDTEVVGSGAGGYVRLEGVTGVDGTLYKKTVTIDNSSGSDQTNFPVKITEDTETLISEGKVESDCSNIRFLDTDNSTELSYYVQTGTCNTDSTEIWVKVPSISSLSVDTIYQYYGGEGADESDFDAVFTVPNDLDNLEAWFKADAIEDVVDGASAATWIDSSSNARHASIQNSPVYKTNIVNGKPIVRFTQSTWQGYTYSTASTQSMFFVFNHPTGSSPHLNGAYETVILGQGSNYPFHGQQGTSLFGCTWASAVVCAGTTYSNGAGTAITSLQKTTSFRILSIVLSSSISTSSLARGHDGGRAMSGDIAEVVIYSDTVTSSERLKLESYLSAKYDIDVSGGLDASLSSESLLVPPSGTWTSPADSNVIDLAWNGGWGDGSTGSSTAFSATVANVTSDATITFKIRTAATAGDLTSEVWSTIGTVNSGTTFTADKDTMDTLSLDMGTDGRYVQIQATYAQTDSNNPQLDSFSLTYLSDDTAPSSNASSLAMQKTQGGSSVSSNGWTNRDEPYLSWTQGADAQAGIKGYCLYLGTDENGDPATSKGILGTSPVSTTGTTCQFIVSATNIDLATEAYQGVTWLTSSTSPYYLNVKAIDYANNIFSASSAAFQFRFDNSTPSNPAFLSMPSDFIATESSTILWPSSGGDGPSDAHSGIAGLQYRIGSSGTWYGESHTGDEDVDDLLTNDGTYTTQQVPDFSSIAEGNNLVYMRTWDMAGNVTTSLVSGVLKVNTVAPGVPQSLEVTPEDATTNAYTFTWDAPSSYTGQEENLVYCYTVNTAPTANTCTFTSAGQTSLSSGAYATQPGTNTMYIVAKDEADNINYDTYASVEFTYSGSAPGIPSNIDISDISIKATSNWKLAISWEEPSDTGAGIASYKVYRSTTATSCSSSFGSFTNIGSTEGTSYTDTGLSQSDYYYCVKACDSANSCGAVSSTVTAYPDGKFTVAAELATEPTETGVTTKKATINWGTGRASDSKVAFGTSSGDYNSEEVSNSTQTTDHTINLTNLNAGTTYFYIAKWTDEDGNTGESDEQSFMTEPAPEVQEVTTSNVSIFSALITFTVKGASEAKIYYGPTTTFGGLAEVSTSTTESTYTVQLTGLEDNTKYFYKINTFDSEKEEYEGDINSFTTLARPTVTNVRIQEVPQAANPTVLVTWSSNTDVSSIVTFYPEGNVEASREEVNAARVSGIHRMLLRGLTPNQRYTLLVKGVDKAGNEAISDSQTFTTSTDTRPPVTSELSVEGNISASKGENKGEVQLIVSWNTDEPSTSQVEFGEGTGTTYSQQTQEDKNLTFNHVVIISGLTPRKVYHLRAISKDSNGNPGRSIDTATIAPKVTDDALNLVLQNLRETFGFLNAIIK